MIAKLPSALFADGFLLAGGLDENRILLLPGEIEKRSFEIIAAELKERNIKLDNKLAPVICRAIHTTADFDYAHTLVFSEGALDKLKELIKSGAAIVTDTNMALSGINKKTLAVFGCVSKMSYGR